MAAAGKQLLVVMTGNSNTGIATLEAARDEFSDQIECRAICRKAAGATQLKEAGVESAPVVDGDIAKPQMLGPVFEGARVAFFSTPNTVNRADLARKFIDACINHGVQYPIIMSMIGADQKGTEFHKQFSACEEYALKMSGKPVKLPIGDKGKLKLSPIILRSANFFENLYGSMAGIQVGTLYYPLGLHGEVSHVSVADVGRVVCKIASDPAPHANKIYNLVAEAHGGNMLASTIAMKAGIPCKYEDVDDAVASQAFQLLGLQKWIAEGQVECLKWYRNGGAENIPKGDIEAILGKKPVRFGDFVTNNLKPMLS